MAGSEMIAETPAFVRVLVDSVVGVAVPELGEYDMMNDTEGR